VPSRSNRKPRAAAIRRSISNTVAAPNPEL
jgi:hypothetical protein